MSEKFNTEVERVLNLVNKQKGRISKWEKFKKNIKKQMHLMMNKGNLSKITLTMDIERQRCASSER